MAAVKRAVPLQSADVAERKQLISAEVMPLEFDPACPLTKLKMWKNNPRRNDAAVPKLAVILKEKGQVSPIVADKKTGIVYKGNTTLKALLSMGKKTARVQWASFPSEAAAIAYGIADNKSSEWAEWDQDVLGGLLSASDTVRRTSGLSEQEQRYLFMEADLEKISSIEEDSSGIKGRTIVVISDINQKSAIVEMLRNLFKSHGITADVK